MRRLPAEWEKQSGVMLTWPHSHSDWRDRLDEAETTFTHIACAISQHETVLIVCFDVAHRQHIERRLQDAGADRQQLRFAIAPSNDTWARDHGPLCVLDHQPTSNNGKKSDAITLLDFHFNGWGGKYAAELDNQITTKLDHANVFGGLPVQSIDLILEGGGIETDGKGTLLATQNCLASDTRNPTLSLAELEHELQQQLGIQRFLWLKHGELLGDDTDGHIDTLARFCDDSTIAYVSCDDPNDAHYPSLALMAEELAAFKTPDNRPYKLVPLPLPNAIYNSQGDRLPATYANFLIINDAVLVPTYNDVKDAIVLETLGACFPQRNIIGIACRPLIQQFGSLHCVTMQFPHGVLQ